MFKVYCVSVIIWMIILIATEKWGKPIVKSKGIDYKKYTTRKHSQGELNIFTTSFIPVIRLAVWLVMLFVIFADEEHLDKIFNGKKED